MSAAPSRSFGSVGVAMVTPFTPSGEVDYDAARALAVSLVDDGADLILLSGTTGESPTEESSTTAVDAPHPPGGDRDGGAR